MKIEPYLQFEEDNYKIFILVGEEKLNPQNDNVDVRVEFVNGETYTATFFTLKNIEYLLNKYKQSGECNSGSFFYCVDIIIVESLTPEKILETIKSLILSGELKSAFSRV